MKQNPLILTILDGFGDFNHSDIDKKYNAIYAANTPNYDYLINNYPHTTLECSGISVGLPDGQMGNSEVGHLNIGAGQIVYQDLTKINKLIANKDFFNNQAFVNLIEKTDKNKKNIHIITLLSDGGIHGHIKHALALLELLHLKKFKYQVFFHLILDGRDTPPKSATSYIKDLQENIDKYHIGEIKSLCGRYYAMDRDHRWDRIELAYKLFTQSIAKHNYKNINEAIDKLYDNVESDEFIEPSLIGKAVNINDGDSIIITNYRADRARQITHALFDTVQKFNNFPKKEINYTDFVTFTKYEDNLNNHIAFPKENLNNTLGEVLALNNLTQLRIAETEKYAHVTFFMSGGIEDKFKDEDRILIPSPKVATYDLKPEMSLEKVTDEICKFIKNKKYDVIITNFANPDMVGHTGNLKAAIIAIEAVDLALGRIFNTIKEHGGEMLITADHGNAEVMYNEINNQPHTAHTNSLVPLIYIGRNATINKSAKYKLSDIAPTMLYLLGLKQPQDMTGESILTLDNNN